MQQFIIKSSVLPRLNAMTEDLGGGYYIVYIEDSNVQELYNAPHIEYIEESKNISYYKPIVRELSDYQNYQSKIHINSYNNHAFNTNLSGQGVYIAIIDSGIDMTHTQFGGDKVAYLWVQSSNEQSSESKPPQGFISGVEYKGADIPKKNYDYVGHGTAVASVAAGSHAELNFLGGVAYDAQLVVVALNTSSTTTVEVMRGIKYCLDKAIQDNKPIVFNLSIGTNDGSHNGQSLFERYIDMVSTMHQGVFVIATGNEGSSGHHFMAQLVSQQGKADASFVVDRLINKLVFSIWYNYNDEFDLRIIVPSNKLDVTITQLKKTDANSWNNGNENELLVEWLRPEFNRLIAQCRITISVESGFINQGIYTMYIIPKKIINGLINAWLPTTGEVSERTVFLNPSPTMTATIPCTAINAISVGGYDSLYQKIADFSGRGNDNIDIYKLIPDVVAPAVNVVAAKSGGGYGVYTGTSFAAPYATGVAALIMQWGIVEKHDNSMYGQRLKAVLQKSAQSQGNTIPSNQWGMGVIDINKAIEEAININK